MPARKTTKTTKSEKPTRTSRRTPTKVASVKASEAPAGTDTVTRLRIKKQHMVIGALLLIAALGILFYRTVLVVGTVNGQPINRLEIIRDLERQQGKQSVDNLITKTLILQEAQKKNITVSEDEINAEIKKIEDNLSKQGQKLDQVLSLNSMTQEQLREQVRVQKLIEKLVGNITVSDKEVNDYIEQNKQNLAEGVNTEDKTFRDETKEQLKQQKLNEKFQSWIAEVRKNAKININIQHLAP